MPTRDDLRELAVLTALGLTLGLLHLALRPGLPLLAAPAAVCEAAGPGVEAVESSVEASVQSSVMPEGGAP